jgi:transcriptional antiterminator NusG
MSEAKWYVIHTYSGYENKVAQTIERVVENRRMKDLIQEVRVPVEKVTRVTVDKKNQKKTKDVEEKIFPSYVLVKMIKTDDTWFIVRNTRGVTGFVGPSSDPTPLTEKEVEALGVNLSSVNVGYEVGSKVRLSGTAKDGTVADGLTGIVAELNKDDKTVSVTVNGYQEPLVLDFHQAVRLDYDVGDTVKVIGTAMDGWTGIVTAINIDAGTVDVKISMFGRETPTTLQLGQVVKE